MQKVIDGKKYRTNGEKYSSKVQPTEISKKQRKAGWYARVIKADGYWRVFSINPAW